MELMGKMGSFFHCVLCAWAWSSNIQLYCQKSIYFTLASCSTRFSLIWYKSCRMIAECEWSVDESFEFFTKVHLLHTSILFNEVLDVGQILLDRCGIRIISNVTRNQHRGIEPINLKFYHSNLIEPISFHIQHLCN